MIDENGVRMAVDIVGGHKTGFYLDQRENRRRVAELARGRRVLNCFCYTAGFSLQALAGGVIAGAGLDVFANEPHVPEALWSMPNVVLTPHMASATHQTRQAMADLAFANMQAGLSGQPLLTPVPECLAGQGR